MAFRAGTNPPRRTRPTRDLRRGTTTPGVPVVGTNPPRRGGFNPGMPRKRPGAGPVPGGGRNGDTTFNPRNGPGARVPGRGGLPVQPPTRRPPTGGIPERPGQGRGPRRRAPGDGDRTFSPRNGPQVPKRPTLNPNRDAQNRRLAARVKKWGFEGYKERFADQNERQKLPSWLSKKGELIGRIPEGASKRKRRRAPGNKLPKRPGLF